MPNGTPNSAASALAREFSLRPARATISTAPRLPPFTCSRNRRAIVPPPMMPTRMRPPVLRPILPQRTIKPASGSDSRQGQGHRGAAKLAARDQHLTLVGFHDIARHREADAVAGYRLVRAD